MCSKYVWLVACLVAAAAFSESVAADEPDPRKPAAITAQEAPPVPPALMARLAQYQSVRGAAFRGFAPDGSGILINTRFANSSQLHRVYQPGGRREQITFFEEPASGGFIPQAKDGSILLSMDTGGNENSQLYFLDRKNFRMTLLTDGKSRHGGGPFNADGTKLVVSSNQRNGRDIDLYIADPRQAGSLKPLMEVDRQMWIATDWSQDGQKLSLLRYVSANEAHPALLDVASGKREDLPLPTGDKSACGSLAFSADCKFVYMATDAGDEFKHLYRLELSSKKFTALSEDIPWDVVDVEVEPTTGDVAFTVNEDGASKLYLLKGGKTPRRELPLPLGIVSGMEFSSDGKQLGLTLARPDAPPDAYTLRLADNELTRWTFSEVGGLNPETFVAPERIQYKSFDGRMIPAYYFRPRGATGDKAARDAKAAVFISIHGGPESQYQPFFNPMIQFYVNELGLAVLCPNVRGSSGYGKTYLTLDNAERRLDSVKDIGGLLDWIETRHELDPQRVAVSGGSYGGFMVLAALVMHGERIKAGIDVVGIANFITFLEKTAGYRVDLRRVEYGDERDPNMKKVFEQISPLNHAEKIQSALMVVHGKNDPRVPFSEAQQIAEKVRSQGRAVWTVYAENEGHGFGKKDNADYLRAVEVMFLKQHLDAE